jgi:hypothetical protein
MNKIDVITYCSGYSYEVFNRFIGSLNDTGFKGNIYIIINQQDKPIIKLLKQKYNNIFPVKDSIEKKTHINCHRFFCIRSLLHNFKINSEYLLLCDSRDVLFQKNIEDYPYDKNVDIYGFLEGKTIEQEQVFNARWIQQIGQILNENIYDKICDKNIICCGTTLGKLDSIKQYVNYMCSFINKNNIINNLDQGIHNYMLHLNILNLNVKILSNEDNLVNTLCNDVHKINSSKQIVNKNEDISWIVHQYDRFSNELKKEISVKYDYTI